MFKFKELPDEEKPRERLVMYGPSNLSNEELLMILLKTGTKKMTVKELAVEVLGYSGGLKNLREMTLNKLMEIEGIGRVKAIEILAVVELSKRVQERVGVQDILKCATPNAIVGYFHELLWEKKQEEFYVLYLNNKKKLLDKKRLFVGSINFSVVHPREIFKHAYLLSASFIICIHNHPSGDPTPSFEDRELTLKLKNIGELHAIYLVDHIIIGNSCYYSFYEDHNVLNTK